MANTKKYVSLDKLGLYDEKIKKYLADADGAVTSELKTYVDDSIKLCDAAGAAATVQGKLDEEVARAKAAEEANAAAAKKAQDEVDALETVVAGKADQTALDALAGKVGTVPEGQNVMGIIGEIQRNAYDDTEIRGLITGLDNNKADKTQVATDIASAKTELEGKITTAQNAADAAQGDIDEFKGTYATDKAALEGAIALKADQTALDEVVEDVADIVKDYLVEADKTELQGKINEKAAQTALDAVSAVANAAATKVELKAEEDRAKGEEARIEGLVTAEAERAAGVEESLQTQINTIMNNPDAEGAINSINEFTKYVEEHGEIAEAFRVDINANAKAIEDHVALAAETYETKEDATTKYDELVALVDEKAVQADWNQNDETAPDYIKNKTHYDGVETVNENLSIICDYETIWGDYTSEQLSVRAGNVWYYKVSDLVLTDEQIQKCKFKTYLSDDEKINTYTISEFSDLLIVEGGLTIAISEEASKDSESVVFVKNDGATFNDATFPEAGIYFGCIATMSGMAYVTELTSTEPIEFSKNVVKQLDEKYIPDTIARVADLEDAAGRIETLEGEMDAVEGRLDVVEPKVDELEGKMTAVEGAVATKAEAQDLTDAIAALEGADAELAGKIEALEGKVDIDGSSVAELIETAKQEAIDAAAQDAADKDVVVLSEAQGYADELNTAMDERVAAVEAASATHALASDVTALAGRVTTAEGEIDTLQSEMDAVEALADAADKAAKANAAAIALKASQADLDAVSGRVTTLETWHNNFTEVSEEEINQLFA